MLAGTLDIMLAKLDKLAKTPGRLLDIKSYKKVKKRLQRGKNLVKRLDIAYIICYI